MYFTRGGCATALLPCRGTFRRGDSGENDDFELSFDVTAVFILYDFTDGVHGDATRKGIFDAIHVARDYGLYLGIFKGEVAILHRAVFKHESLTVAKGLCTDNTAIDKANVLRVPAEVFSANLAIVDGHTVAMPESILGVQNTIVNDEVFTILEGVLSL